MWLNKKEWIAVALIVTVLATGILYYFFNPHYTSRIISSAQTSDTLNIHPDDPENEKLIIKVDGNSSEEYILRLNLIYKNEGKRSLDQSDSIKIPAGNLKAVFTRKFDVAPQLEAAQIIYQAKSNTSKIDLRLEAGIF